MNRRAFLRGATTTLAVLPFGVFLVHCSSSDNGSATTTNPTEPTTDTTPPDAPPRVEGGDVVYTSSQTSAHSHTFAVPSADLTSPPPAGLSGVTSQSDLHSHLVAISVADFQSVVAGQSVKVETTLVSGHTHTFTFVKIA